MEPQGGAVAHSPPPHCLLCGTSHIWLERRKEIYTPVRESVGDYLRSNAAWLSRHRLTYLFFIPICPLLSPCPPCCPPPQVRLLVKADVQGSVEALVAALEALGNSLGVRCKHLTHTSSTPRFTPAPTPAPTPRCRARVLHGGVGPLSASDVNLAVAAGAHIVMFNQQSYQSRWE